MAHYRVVRRKITTSEWYGCDSIRRDAIAFCAERKTWLGWRTLRVGARGIKSKGYAVYPTQFKAEEVIATHALSRSEDKKKSLDVVSEFEYIGPTKLDHILERLDYGTEAERLR